MSAIRRLAVAAVAVASSVAAAPGQGHGAATGERSAPPLFDDLGSYHRAVTTASESVQAYFDQGLRLLFAFNLEEAQRSFEEAAARDPRCAACWWGLGMSLSPHYNLPGLPERTAAGARAVARGLAVSSDKPEIERDLLAALAKRLSDPAPETPEGYAALDRAYAAAMEKLAKKYPDDLEVQAYYAEALMNLRPWRLYTLAGEPEPGTLEIVAQLEAVLAKSPDHPGANHMLIHALEASNNPEKAVAAAERIARTLPGAAHIVHMPAHIYMRVGRHADVVSSNQLAVKADEDYITQCRAQGIYPLGYYPHNIHFIWMGATASGQRALALESARRVAAAIPHEALGQVPILQGFLVVPYWAMVRFGQWNDILADNGPRHETVVTKGAWRYARAMAYTALDRLSDAEAELAELQTLLADPSLKEQTTFSTNNGLAILRIAPEVIAGEI
ncbi:MAG: hypothetical protein ACREI7_03145, partial [Myxococcota bacterium]